MGRRNLKRTGWLALMYAFADVICVGMGMGVPVFCILLGLVVGGYLAVRVVPRANSTREILRRIMQGAALTSAFTMVLMALVWGPSITKLFDPAFDVANYGIPLIFYEPLASFIGWMGLMILISPALQFLVTLFGAHVAWFWLIGQREKVAQHEAPAQDVALGQPEEVGLAQN